MKKIICFSGIFAITILYIIATYLFIIKEFDKLDMKKNEELLNFGTIIYSKLNFEDAKEIFYTMRTEENGYFYLSRRSDSVNIIHPRKSKENISYWDKPERRTLELDRLHKEIEEEKTGYVYYPSTGIDGNNIVKKVSLFIPVDDENTLALAIPRNLINKSLLSILVFNLIFGGVILMLLLHIIKKKR